MQACGFDPQYMGSNPISSANLSYTIKSSRREGDIKSMVSVIGQIKVAGSYAT